MIGLLIGGITRLGFAVTCSRLYNPRETERAAMMQWGMLVYHAAVVHIIITGSIVLCDGYLALNSWWTRSILTRVITGGISRYLETSSTTPFITIFVYLLILMVASLISGITDVPLKLVSGTGRLARLVRLADDPVNDVPLWYRAWEIDRASFKKHHLEAVSSEHKPIEVGVQMLVRMKNGDVYIGKLHEYQLKSDEGNSKDIMLGEEVTLWPNGDTSKEVVLSFDEGRGGTLINSENVSSIQYLYFTEDQV